MSTVDRSTAYDGVSKRRPRRALQPLERDILCRVIDDITYACTREGTLDALMFISGNHGIRMDLDELKMLQEIRDAIDPRPEDG